MVLRRISLYFILTFVIVHQPGYGQRNVEYNNDNTICVQDVQNIGYLGFFAWSGKQVLDALVGNEFLTEREWRSIEMNPQLALFIKESADLAHDISRTMCPEDPNSTSNTAYEVDDEVDAIRHFVMSSYLTWKAGPEAARYFMASHEDHLFANDNLMDYYNNDLGFQFGQRFIQRHQDDPLFSNPLPTFIAEIKAEIRRKHSLPRGDHQDFLVLKSGPSTCAKSKYPNF